MSEQPQSAAPGQPQPEQIPMEIWVATLQAELADKANQLLQAAARIRLRDETIRALQEQNVALQKRVTEFEDRDGLPDAA